MPFLGYHYIRGLEIAKDDWWLLLVKVSQDITELARVRHNLCDRNWTRIILSKYL